MAWTAHGDWDLSLLPVVRRDAQALLAWWGSSTPATFFIVSSSRHSWLSLAVHGFLSSWGCGVLLSSSQG